MYFLDEAFRRQVLRQFSILNYKLDQLSDELTRRMKVQEPEETQDKMLDTFGFPLKSIQELQQLEELIIDKNKAEQLVS